MAIKTPALLTVSTEASVTDVYTSQTITPAAVTASMITLTSADIGGDSGASLTLGKKYRLAVSGTVYNDTLYWDTDADEHFFKILSTAGTPASQDITTISLITDAEKDLNVSGVAAVDTLNLKSVWVTDEDYTIDDETIVYATTTSTNQNDITFPEITTANHGRVIIVRVDVGTGNVDLVPQTGQQLATGGASTKLTVTADGSYIFQADYFSATAPDWKQVLISVV